MLILIVHMILSAILFSDAKIQYSCLTTKFLCHDFTLYLFQIGCGDVGGGDEGDALQFDDDATLAGSTGHQTSDTLELAISDNDRLATHVMNIFGINLHDVVIVDAADANEVHHALIVNFHHRVGSVGMGVTVVVIETNKGNLGSVVDILFDQIFSAVHEYQAPDKRRLDPLQLAVDLLLDEVHGNIGIGVLVVVDNEIIGLLCPFVGGT